MSSVIDRFMRYISIDTQSDEDSPSSPSTAKQFRLARLLAEEMTEMGISGVRLDDRHCYVYGEIPSNLDADIPAIGFISHMDTSPSAPGDAPFEPIPLLLLPFSRLDRKYVSSWSFLPIRHNCLFISTSRSDSEFGKQIWRFPYWAAPCRS